MRKVIIALAFLLAIVANTTTANAEGRKKSKKSHATVTKYTCTMHPEIIRNKPGKCPKCGMKLVPVKK